MTFAFPMSSSSRASNSLDIPANLSDDAPYQMPLRMTMGDRRKLLFKAAQDPETSSPTAWLLKKIREGEVAGAASVKETVLAVQAAVSKGITFVLDKRRQEAADEFAERLGLPDTSYLARELLSRALDEPELAEELLFGKIRARSQRQAEAELSQHPSLKKTA